jgi:predicted metal-dependent phosphoesterase TrpH
LIDLHLHTTASDGHLVPEELVKAAAAAGLTVLAVTDHDTTDAVDEVRRLAAADGIEAIAGIEITAVEDGRDVHVLGYFLDPADPGLVEFLTEQRENRIARIEAIGARLAALGMPIEVSALVADVRRHRSRSIGRPQVARAMVAAGYAADTREAFERWLGDGRPAFVPRTGCGVETVIGVIHRAGGLASLAHPGRTAVDARIPALAAVGLDAIEVYHRDHDETLVDRYRRLADDLSLLVTGGSDFHGDPSHGLSPGSVTLPADAWERLSAERRRHALSR